MDCGGAHHHPGARARRRRRGGAVRRTIEPSSAPYADRARECATAEAEIGPLRTADPATAASIADLRGAPAGDARGGREPGVLDFADGAGFHDLPAPGS
ncbi:MAG: hypothetical protein R2713_00535 [Ilumatobacteraceae bacterium]